MVESGNQRGVILLMTTALMHDLQIIYNIPIERLQNYRDKRVIVRVREPASLLGLLAAESPESVVGVQLLSLAADSETLNAWAPGLPLELIIADPAVEFPLLYRHVNLLDNHPVRVIVPVSPGFSKAVKVAVALDFAVSLAVGQPDPVLIEELAEVMTFYLRQPTVAQPIEFFHSALLSFYHEEPVPLWVLLDEDPRCFRFISDDGVENLPGRLANAAINDRTNADLDQEIGQVLAANEDCQHCEFLQNCGGYFKWPNHTYRCTGVKQLLGDLQNAAVELRRDMAQAPN